MKLWRKEYDIINSARYDILEALDGRELPANFIARTAGIRIQVVYYHLNLLTEHGLIDKRDTTKKTVHKKAKNKEKPITMYSLSSKGIEALKYFPKTQKARKYLWN